MPHMLQKMDQRKDPPIPENSMEDINLSCA